MSRDSGHNGDFAGGDPSRDPLIRRIQALGPRALDRPEDLALFQGYMAHPDEHMRELVELQVSQAEAQQALAEDPYYTAYPPASQPLTAEVPVWAGVMPTGEGLPIPLSRLASGTCFVGPNGMAKTTLAQHLTRQVVRCGDGCFVVLDIKGTWRGLAHWPDMQDRVLVLRAQELAVSLLQPPPGVSLEDWLVPLSSVFQMAFRLFAAQRLLRHEALRLMEHFSRGLYPSLAMLRDWVEAFRPGRGTREVNYKESVLGALQSLEDTLGIFGYTCSNMLGRLFAEPRVVVIEAGGTPADELCFLACLLIEWLFIHRRFNPGEGRMLVDFVLEDASPVVGPQRSRETPGGLSLLDQRAMLTREMNVGLLVIAHEFAQLSDPLVAACENLVAFSPRRDPDSLLQRLFSVDRDQTKAMKRYDRGTAVASIPSVWPYAVPIRFPPPPVRVEGSVDPVERTRQTFFKGIEATEAARIRLPGRVASTAPSSSGGRREKHPPHEAKQAPQTAAEAWPDLWQRLMTLLAAPVPPPLVQLFDRVGVARREGSKAVRELENAGLVRPHSVSRGRGGALKLLEVTAYGEAELKKRGIQPPQRPTRGDWLHQVTAAALGERVRREEGRSVTFEAPVGDRHCDARWWSRKGQLHLAEIGISCPEREVSHTVKLFERLTETEFRFVLVCADRKFETKYLRQLKAKAPDAAKQITTRLAGQLIVQCFE